MEEPAGYVGLAFKTGGFINYANVADPEVDAAIEKAQTALTPEAALGPVHEVARLVHAKVYDNVLYYQNFQFAYNQDRWDGFVPLPSDLLSLINPLSLASAKAK
jgi:peptide/nickel transport system substrate-binding protein